MLQSAPFFIEVGGKLLKCAHVHHLKPVLQLLEMVHSDRCPPVSTSDLTILLFIATVTMT